MIFKRQDSAFAEKGLLGGQKGVILPLSLIFLLILCFMGIAAIMTSSSTSNMFGGMKRTDEALYLAEAGTEAAQRLIAQTNPNFRQVYMDTGKLPGLENVVTLGNGTYMVRILNNDDDPCYSTNDECDGRYLIRATGVVADTVKTLEVVVEAFSRFFYFTEVEEAPGSYGDDTKTIDEKYVYFKGGDVMDGPVHTNGNDTQSPRPGAQTGFHFAGNPGPVFKDTVSSYKQPTYLGDAAPTFQKGTNWSRKVNLPVGPDKTFGTEDDLMEVFEGAMSKGRLIDTFNDPKNLPDHGDKNPDKYATGGTTTSFRVHFCAGGDTGADQKIIIWKYVYKDATQTDMEWKKHGDDLTIGADFNGVLYFYGGGSVYVGGKIGTDGILDTTAGAESNSWVKGRWTVCSGLSPGDKTVSPEIPKDSDRGLTAAGQLFIQGDIRYVGDYGDKDINPSKKIFPIIKDTDGNETVKAQGNLLGLVSANNVTIAYNDVGGALIQPIIQNGVVIHGSIMAASSQQSGSFMVNVNYHDSAKMTPGNPIYLFGGLIQYTRGVVGKFEIAGTVTGGFSKAYRYDKRLLYMTPPSFPVAVNLNMRSWRE